jgi:hypothetical protein
MAPAPLLKRRRCCILDLGYLLHDSKPKGSSLNRNMLLNAGASMIGNDSDLLLTTGFVSDSSMPQSMFYFFLLRLLALPLSHYILALRVRSRKRVECRLDSFAAPTTNKGC